MLEVEKPKSRVCGDCTLCCKLLNIEEINKPANKWCPDCKIGEGCGVYETRPTPCRTFKCAWLGNLLPESERPDTRGALAYFVRSPATGRDVIVLAVDTHRPDAWKRSKIRVWLEQMIRHTPVVVVCGATTTPLEDVLRR
jgi:hypothetical protein